MFSFVDAILSETQPIVNPPTPQPLLLPSTPPGKNHPLGAVGHPALLPMSNSFSNHKEGTGNHYYLI